MGVANPGCVTRRAYQLCRNTLSHSRGPRSPRCLAGCSARNASVIGAPNTSRIGTSIDSSMCCTMCTLNSTYA